MAHGSHYQRHAVAFVLDSTGQARSQKVLYSVMNNLKFIICDISFQMIETPKFTHIIGF